MGGSKPPVSEPVPFLQVSAWFGWLDFLKYQADRFGKKISWINLDETSIKRSDASSGLVVKRSWWPAGHQAPGPAGSTREQRGCATFVCLCTPDTALQAALPKIWIGNQYLFKASELKACASRQPPQVVLLREKTAWMTAALMPRIFKEIAASLKTFGENRQGVVVMDAAPQHVPGSVIRAAADFGLWVVILPAKLTHLCQPADTHVFSALKSACRQWCTRSRLACPNGQFPDSAWFDMMFEISTKFLCGRPWHRAFEANGIVGDRSALSPALQSHALQNFTAVEAGHVCMPTEEQLQSIFPKNKQVPFCDLMRPLIPRLE